MARYSCSTAGHFYDHENPRKAMSYALVIARLNEQDEIIKKQAEKIERFKSALIMLHGFGLQELGMREFEIIDAALKGENHE